MTEWLFLAAAATGVTTISASGDTGSSGCAPSDQSAAVQYPSESPNVLSVGGTEFADNTSSRGFAVWKDESAETAGGGGPSSHFPLPDYQDQASLSGPVRQTPDVAFLADPGDIGPIILCQPGQACDTQVVAGTSATAPGVAGGLAIVMHRSAAHSHGRLGLINPWLYRSLTENPRGARAIDITTGDNDIYGAGCCAATPGFDMASGWGSIRFDSIFPEQSTGRH